jgi:hypothetical protein
MTEEKINKSDSSKLDDFIQSARDYVEKAPDRKAAAEKRMQDYTETNAKNRAQFKENMDKIGRGGMGGAGGFEDPMKKGVTNKMPSMKKGGKVAGKLATRGYGKARK